MWKKLLIGCVAMFLLAVTGGVLLFMVIVGKIKSTDVYQLATTQLSADANVAAVLGHVTGFGFMPSGGISWKGTTGEADFSIKINGEKQNGTAYVKATKTASEWTMTLFQVHAEDGQKIDLLAASTLTAPSDSGGIAPPPAQPVAENPPAGSGGFVLPGGMTIDGGSAADSAPAGGEAFPPANAGSLRVSDFFFCDSTGTNRMAPGVLRPGRAYWRVVVEGLVPNANGELHVKEDLRIIAPTGEVLVDRQGLVETRLQAAAGTPVSLANDLTLVDALPAGVYRAQIMIRDQTAGTAIPYETTFQFSP